MKTFIFGLVLLGAGYCAGASDAATAIETAREWLNRAPMIAEGISTEPDAVQLVEPQGGDSYYVVTLVGGGYVVLGSADDVESVIAFSASGSFPDTKWSKLLSQPADNVKRRVYASGRSTLSDVRVAPLVQSKWGQHTDTGYSNTGNPCYNLYTPKQYPCGCVATAMAQVMRYWRYPASVRAFSRTCYADGLATVLSVAAGAYAWGDMPLDPSQGTTPAQRRAIGKLTYDCGVSLCMSYSRYGSGAVGGFAYLPLKETFGYANAFTYCPDVITSQELERAVYASLDAGCPVMIGFSGSGNEFHEAVADGYGFVSGTAYVHLNIGWTSISGSDLWYNLPRVTFTIEDNSASYVKVEHVIYNILPDETGSVLSGRVTDKGGKAAAGIVVSVSKSGSAAVLATTRTSSTGVYAFVLPGGVRYDITVGGVTKSGVLLNAAVNPDSVDLQTGVYYPGRMACGNSWGNDFVLGETPTPVDPQPEVPSGPSVAVDCGLLGDGVELTVGQAVCFPLEFKCVECSIKSVKASGLPSGLKLLTGKKAAPYAYLIAGTPTKATTKACEVKLTVQVKPDDGSVKMPAQVFTGEVVVNPLAAWSTGSFVGIVEVGDDVGVFTMTAKASGALTGKVTLGKKSYSFKSTGFAAATDEHCRVVVSPAKLGELAFDIVPVDFGEGTVGAIANGGVTAAQSIWQLKEYKSLLPKYTSADKTLSWTTAGKVTWTAKIDGKKAKLTSTLLPVSRDGGGLALCAYFVSGRTVIRLDVRYDGKASAAPECEFVYLTGEAAED